MKNLKQYLTIVFSLILAFSCTNETIEKSELQQINYDELNLKVDEYLSSFEAHFKSEKTLLNAFESLHNETEKSSEVPLMTINIDISSDRVEYTSEDLADIYSIEQKVFLLKYFNEAANIRGSELREVILKHKSKLESIVLSKEEYNQIFSILDTAEKTVIYIEEMVASTQSSKNYYSLSEKSNCFWDCMAGKGSTIGRGMVEGIVVGTISGGIKGAAGGTIILPGIGSATGGVGGAVLGAAGGAVIGAIGGTFWASADCAIQCGREKTTASRGCVNISGANKVCLKQFEL